MRQILIATGAALAAALIVLGGATASWWSHSEGDLSSAIGLRSVSMCRTQGCVHTTLEALGRDVAWIRTGHAGYAAALLAGGLLLVVAVMTAAGRTSRVLRRTTGVAVLAALVTGVAFVAMAPDHDGMKPSYSMLMYFVGAVMGAVSAALAPRSPASR